MGRSFWAPQRHFRRNRWGSPTVPPSWHLIASHAIPIARGEGGVRDERGGDRGQGAGGRGQGDRGQGTGDRVEAQGKRGRTRVCSLSHPPSYGPPLTTIPYPLSPVPCPLS